MALKIEYLSLDKISTYEKNARQHSDEQISQLVNSITEFGFTNPVLIDENGSLIAGHGRLAAAEIIGLDSVPAIRLIGLSENQIKALRIADNQLALNSTWDLDLLAAELSDLDAEEFDIDLLGFDDDFLRGLLSDPVDDETPQEDPEGDEPEASDKVAIMIGPYELKIKRFDWDKWETAIRAKAGFEKDDIQNEIRKRLGF